MAVNWQRALMRMIGAREQPIRVVSVEDLLPWYRRISFSAPDFLRDLELFPTVWVRLWVPSLEDPTVMKQRGFTLVDPDPVAGTFSMDFVIHEPTGPAATWALCAKPGDPVEIAFTPAKLTPDPGIGRFVLLGDSTAVPGINSLLDYLPAGASAEVLLHDAHDDADRLPLRLRDGVTLTLTQTSEEQLAAVRSLDLDLADTYVWAAGERKAIAATREIVRKEWRLPRDRQHTQYYWIEGKPFG